MVVLVVLDGWGYRTETAHNAIAAAVKPTWDRWWNKQPHTLIQGSARFVGLPEGQMGNSEVGHMNLGAGRVVYQDSMRIFKAIEDGSFFRNEALQKACHSGGTLHVMGLLSPGGVHSHEQHIHAMMRLAHQQGVQGLRFHAFLDGRDTPPRSALDSIAALEQVMAELGVGRIASVVGRYYAMDRDKRWERVEPAYDLVASGEGAFSYGSAREALEAAYARGETDEFVQATTVGTPVRIEDGDVVVYMNFRSDRARELTKAFLDNGFDGFQRKRLPVLGGYYTLTLYDKTETRAKVVFPPQSIENGFGEYVSRLGLKQLRIAETEKYPHVTFFFNGGEERVYDGEDRILVPSPKVATYDLKPEMSAFEVTDKLVEAILSRKYDVIICNYANADMVGHTGILSAAILAIEAVDTCIGRAVAAMQSIGGEVLITADHGNAEAMQDHLNQQPHTQHTTNLVPFLYVGRPAQLAETGALSDIAPTMLTLMGLPQPKEMTGQALVDLNAAPMAVNAQ
jgi:2,3-bisphosphoglycerate-independent phosphoglycerate mutase